jgi:hypothetical protein
VITADDVMKAIGDQLSAAANWSAAVPGGVFFARGPETPAAYPYIVAQVQGGRAEVFSGSLYIQPWSVRLAAYCQAGGAVNARTVEQLMNGQLVTLAGQTAMRGAILRNNTEKVLHIVPAAGDGKYAPELRSGQDVFVAGLTVDLLLQGDRSVS